MARDVGMELFAYGNGMWGERLDVPELPGSESVEGIYSLRRRRRGTNAERATARQEALPVRGLHDLR